MQFLAKFATNQTNQNGEDTGIANAKSVWAIELAGYTGDEIRRGLTARYAYPPSCDQFAEACRATITAESAYSEAVEQMQRRSEGRDAWTHPAIYWAAATIGGDLRTVAAGQMSARWARVFGAELAKGEWPPIPARMSALPAPGSKSADRDGVRRVAEAVGGIVRPRTDHRAWAKWHKAEYMAGRPPRCGDSFPFAAKALGEDMEQWEAEKKAAQQISAAATAKNASRWAYDDGSATI